VVKVESNIVFARQAAVLMDSSSSPEDVMETGNHALISFYNGEKVEIIESLRLPRFYGKAACSTAVVEPRTELRHHLLLNTLRVYQQVQVWLGNGDQELLPEQWGWKVSEEKLVPPTIHQHLIPVIRCVCKTGCYTMRFTCRKKRTGLFHGLQ